MNTPQQLYLNQVIQALKIEYTDDLEQYKSLFNKNNIAYRKTQGVTWYPIKVNKEDIGAGDYLILEIERTNSLNKPHRFNGGKVVHFFSNNNEVKELKGTIKTVVQNKMRISLTVDELPDWFYEGQIGVNIMFDDAGYKEMFHVLDLVKNAHNNRLAELRDVIYNLAIAKFDINQNVIIPYFNNSQNKALNMCLQAKDLAIVHGPPGTGKTTTLVQTINHILKTEKQILVTCPSNTGVDLLVEKLSAQGINVLRLGNPARINDTVLHNSLDYKTVNHQSYKEIKELKKQAEEFHRMAQKYKRNFGPAERQQRHLLYTEAKKRAKEAEHLEDYIVNDEIKKAGVIACTPMGCNHRLLRDRVFETIIIDEAAQALEPMCWLAIAKAKRVIMAGDHLQLPPTVKSKNKEVLILKETLFEKAIKQAEVSTMLNVQYRMHEKIMQFSNQQFYNNELQADITVKNTLLLPNSLYGNTPVTFIDTAGCGYTETLNPETLSLSNKEEAQLLFTYLDKVVQDYFEHDSLAKLFIGIISPYREQVSLIEEMLELDHVAQNIAGLKKEKKIHLQIKSIDGFQGQEKDIICISLVRSNDNADIGFLSDFRRMNVALTRAKKKLIVIGDSATLAQNKFYKSFIEYTEEIGAYISAWEFVS